MVSFSKYLPLFLKHCSIISIIYICLLYFTLSLEKLVLRRDTVYIDYCLLAERKDSLDGLQAHSINSHACDFKGFERVTGSSRQGYVASAIYRVL